MATINIEIPGNGVPVDISAGLETKFYTYQMVPRSAVMLIT